MGVQQTKHQVRDIAVRLYRDGAGEPVVFLHGAAGVPPWGPFFEKLATRYDLMLPEHPGFGASDNPAAIRNVADAAMYYLDFLDGLGAKVHLIGHSLGGWMAAELAVRNATRLRSLTLIAPAGVRIKGLPCGDNFIWAPDELARNLFHDQSFAERMIAQGQAMTDDEADVALTNRFAAAKYGWEPRWFNPALERWLHRITPPTFVIWGAEDKILPYAYADVWKGRVPGLRVEILQQCGHLPHIEQADATAEKVLGFLAGVRS
jgi:pimeloyl-ACP methyl ester carboxylesterase